MHAAPSVVMPTVVVVMVGWLDRNQPRRAAIISLGPGSVGVDGRIGVARTRGLGAGRQSGQQDERGEESESTHAFDMVGA
jgi:hypothetical protein